MRTKIWLGALKGRDHPEYLLVNGMIILKFILGKYGWKVWTGSSGTEYATAAGYFEHGSERNVSINGGKFLHKLNALLVSEERL